MPISSYHLIEMETTKINMRKCLNMLKTAITICSAYLSQNRTDIIFISSNFVRDNFGNLTIQLQTLNSTLR